mmetsp:Transcript_22565/g.33755  ORF Transcript_22565/g.33755 Transcript_22565/m.33755 type:complete len:280 (-) Transcript_22565:699-1538(-)
MHKSIFLRCCTAFVPSVNKPNLFAVNPVTKPTIAITSTGAHSDATLFPLSGSVRGSLSLGNILKVNSQRQYFLSYHSTSKLLLSSSNDGNGNNGNDADADGIMVDTSTYSNQYKKNYHISGVGTKSFVSMKTNTNHTIQTDVPKKMGGGDDAPQPVETLLAAWVGCTQATALYVGRNMEPRLLIEKIEFDVEAYRDERGALGGELPICSGSALPDLPARLEKVTGTVKVYLRGKRQGEGVPLLTEEQLFLLGEHTERRCPVANMMAMSGIEMNIQWING